MTELFNMTREEWLKIMKEQREKITLLEATNESLKESVRILVRQNDILLDKIHEVA